MANEGNLRPIRTKSEARELGRKGGIASGEARRRKKTMRETAQLILDMQIPNAAKELKAKLKAMGLTEEDFTYQSAIMIGIVNQAMKGNTKAAAFLRDTVGENPMMLQEESGPSLADAIEEAYRERMGEAKDNVE